MAGNVCAQKKSLYSRLRLIGTQNMGTFVPIIRMFQLSCGRILYELTQVVYRTIVLIKQSAN